MARVLMARTILRSSELNYVKFVDLPTFRPYFHHDEVFTSSVVRIVILFYLHTLSPLTKVAESRSLSNLLLPW